MPRFRDIYGSHGGRDFVRIFDFWHPQVGVQAFGLSTRGGGVIHTRMVAGQPCRQHSRGNHGWRFTAPIQTAVRFELNCLDTAI